MVLWVLARREPSFSKEVLHKGSTSTHGQRVHTLQLVRFDIHAPLRHLHQSVEQLLSLRNHQETWRHFLSIAILRTFRGTKDSQKYLPPSGTASSRFPRDGGHLEAGSLRQTMMQNLSGGSPSFISSRSWGNCSCSCKALLVSVNREFSNLVRSEGPTRNRR